MKYLLVSVPSDKSVMSRLASTLDAEEKIPILRQISMHCSAVSSLNSTSSEMPSALPLSRSKRSCEVNSIRPVAEPLLSLDSSSVKLWVVLVASSTTISQPSCVANHARIFTSASAASFSVPATTSGSLCRKKLRSWRWKTSLELPCSHTW